MPVLLMIGAVAVIAILMGIGIRQRWDPSPGPLPPSSMSVPATASDSAPLPRWYWPLAITSPLLLVLLVYVSAALDRRWIAVSGFILFGMTWTARQAAILWTSAESRLGRTVAVIRPASLFAGAVAGAATESVWWLVAGATVYLAILPVMEVVERQPDRRTIVPRNDPHDVPERGDTRR